MIGNPFALPRAEWKTIALVGLGLALTPVYKTAFSLAFAPIYFQLDSGSVDMILVVQVYAVAAGAALFLAGILADRFGPGAVFLAGLALSPAAFALAAAFPGYWPLLGFGLLRGLADGAAWSAGFVILATCVGAERRGRAFGIREVFVVLGGLAAAAAIGPLMLSADWRTTFSIVGAVGIVVLALAWLFRDALGDAAPHRLRETGKRDKVPAGVLATIATVASLPVLLFLLALTSLQFAENAADRAAKAFERVSNGLPGASADAGSELQLVALLVVLLSGAALMLVPLAGGVWADRSDKPERLVATCLVPYAILFGIAALDVIPVPVTIWLGLGPVLVALAGPAIALLILRICPTGRIGTVYGFVATGTPIGGALAIWSAGALTESGMAEAVLWLSAVAILLGAIGIYAVRAVSR